MCRAAGSAQCLSFLWPSRVMPARNGAQRAHRARACGAASRAARSAQRAYYQDNQRNITTRRGAARQSSLFVAMSYALPYTAHGMALLPRVRAWRCSGCAFCRNVSQHARALRYSAATITAPARIARNMAFIARNAAALGSLPPPRSAHARTLL